MSLISILKRKNNKILFTTPSHGGRFCIYHKFYQWYRSDISEVDAYKPEIALEKAEKKASKIYRSKYTKFLTNGSSSGIIAAVIASEAQKVLIWDKSHPCHRNACKLANANIIEYSLPFDNNLGVYKAITTDKVIELIQIHKPKAIIITSPTYEGFVADIREISSVCKKNRVKLIVDEAHGALYPFSDRLPETAIKHADYTVQSLHKTAGGINPTALLHSNDNNPNKALNMISTTSPSYPMLSTIEANINYLDSNKGRKKIEKLIDNIKELHLEQLNDDPTKILIKGGFTLSEKLYNKYNIEDERTNDKTTLLLCGIGTSKKMLNKLKRALDNICL